MPLTKKCTKCDTVKLKTEFYPNSRMRDGFNTFCILCHKADNVARKKRNRADLSFKKAENEAKKQYRARNVEKTRAYMLQWRKANRIGISEYGAKYRQVHKAKYAYLCQKRKLDLLNRTPKWLTVDDLWVISEIYALAEERTVATGVKWHVDHIIPLRGRYVSGLHVPNNLQVVPWYQNQSKSNRFEV